MAFEIDTTIRVQIQKAIMGDFAVDNPQKITPPPLQEDVRRFEQLLEVKDPSEYTFLSGPKNLEEVSAASRIMTREEALQSAEQFLERIGPGGGGLIPEELYRLQASIKVVSIESTVALQTSQSVEQGIDSTIKQQ